MSVAINPPCWGCKVTAKGWLGVGGRGGKEGIGMRRDARLERTVLIRVSFVCSSTVDAFTHGSYLGNFSKRSPFFSEVDDHATSPFFELP